MTKHDVPEGRGGRRHVTEASPVIRDNVSSGYSEPRAHLAQQRRSHPPA